MMLRPLLRVFIIILSGLVLVAGASSGAGLTVSSRPRGSTVELSGPVRISGTTPFEFPGAQSGRFRVRVLKPGYETGVGWMHLTAATPGGPVHGASAVHVPDLTLTLTGLAGPSKLLRGERRKGIILSIAQGAAAVAASVAEWRARDFGDKYDELRGKYVSAQSEGEAEFYHAGMQHNYELRRNAIDTRNAYLIATVVPAFYVLVENLLLDRGGALMAVRDDELTFGLRPVSMPSAMLRGTLFPGMGHVYSGQKTMGTVWGVSVLSAVGAALVADAYYRDSRLEYDEILSVYQNADTEEKASVARADLEDSFESMEDTYQLRRVLRGVALGLWVLSVLDAGRVATSAWGEPASSESRSFSMKVYGVSNGLKIGLKIPVG